MFDSPFLIPSGYYPCRGALPLPATLSALKATPTPVELDRLEIVYGRPPPRLSAAAREWMAGSRLGAQQNALSSRDRAALESAPHTNSARDASTCCWSRRRHALIARRAGRAALANFSRAASRCPRQQDRGAPIGAGS